MFHSCLQRINWKISTFEYIQTKVNKTHGVQSPGGIVDSEYMGNLEALELRRVLAVPVVAHVQARQNLRQKIKRELSFTLEAAGKM